MWGNIVNVSRHDSDSRWLPLRRHPDTSVKYEGDNPLRLAEEIHAALDKYGLGNNRRMFTRIKFFGGELCLIADCLHCAGPQKVVKQPRGALNFEGAADEKSMPGWSAGSWTGSWRGWSYCLQLQHWASPCCRTMPSPNKRRTRGQWWELRRPFLRACWTMITHDWNIAIKPSLRR